VLLGVVVPVDKPVSWCLAALIGSLCVSSTSSTSPHSIAGPWIAGARGVTVLCARSPHAVLVLGLDRRLVLEVARTLNVT